MSRREILKSLASGCAVYALVAACSGIGASDGQADASSGGATGVNGSAGDSSSSGSVPSAHADTGGGSTNDQDSCECKAPEPEPDVFIDVPCKDSPDSSYVCIETTAHSPEDLIGQFSAIVRCDDGGSGFGPPGRGFVPMMGVENSGRICAHCLSPTGNAGSCESGKVVTFKLPKTLAE